MGVSIVRFSNNAKHTTWSWLQVKWRIVAAIPVSHLRRKSCATVRREQPCRCAGALTEDLDTRHFARDDPRGFLSGYSNGAVLDEIQWAPDLVSYLQGIVDSDAAPGRFILTGSQQFAVMDSINQSLAGRTALLRLLPFSLAEAGRYDWEAGLDA